MAKIYKIVLTYESTHQIDNSTIFRKHVFIKYKRNEEEVNAAIKATLYNSSKMNFHRSFGYTVSEIDISDEEMEKLEPLCQYGTSAVYNEDGSLYSKVMDRKLPITK